MKYKFIVLFFLSFLSQFSYASKLTIEDKGLRQVFNAYCFECHDDTAEGGLDLDKLESDLSDPKALAKWVTIFDMVDQGEMPPKKKDQPTKLEKQRFLKTIEAKLDVSHSIKKGTVLRRLNRSEYENTMNDLFGTNLELAQKFPEDGKSHEFENIGEALSVSMTQVQRYLECADEVMDTAIARELEKPASALKVLRYSDDERNEKFYGDQWIKTPEGATVFYRSLSYPSGMMRKASAKKSGYYKVRVKGYATQSKQAITFGLSGATYERGAAPINFGYFDMPVGDAKNIKTIETEIWVKKNYMLKVEPCGLNDIDNLIKKHGIENYKGAGLVIDSIEMEGPIISEYPSRGHELIFSGVDRVEIEPRNPKDKMKSWYVPKFEIKLENPKEKAAGVLLRVANKAFRRPVESVQIESYLELFEKEFSAHDSFEKAIKTAIASLLCSADFLYFKEKVGQLDDYALANRLSYFLTRTAPDVKLMTLASGGKLSQNNKTLLAEVERLLSSKFSSRFYEDFTDAWLELRSIDFTSPDKKLFPEFDTYLKHSMVDETRAYLKELIDQNYSVTNIVKSNFSMLNNRLAEHYELAPIEGAEIRKVALDKESVRGGFISQGSILKVSSNGTNTSPVVRGVWLNERILGLTTRPPPPGVPGVEPDIRGATTLREILDKHRDKNSCRACHQVIDPPGFALESFNPVGSWREKFRVSGKGSIGERVRKVVYGKRVQFKVGLDVDAASELPNGKTFDGFKGFRDDLSTQKEQLAKAFVTKLMTFATGRDMGFSDRKEIERIAKDHAPDYGLKDLLKSVITSKIFKYK